MTELTVGLGDRAYPITIEYHCLDTIGENLLEKKIGNRYCIITDSTVAELYGEIVKNSWKNKVLKVKCWYFMLARKVKILLLYNFVSQNGSNEI